MRKIGALAVSLVLASVMLAGAASQQLTTFGMLFPTPPARWSTTSLTDTGPINAAGEKLAFCGRAWFAARTGTKDISRVGFRFGQVTKAGGSGLTVSLQDVNAALGSGAVIQPDETQDQTVAITNADAGFDDNLWYRTGTLSANRTVAFGDLLCVVVEYDGSGWQASDSVTLSGLSLSSDPQSHYPATVLKATNWSIDARWPNVVLEFSGGDFGMLMLAPPIKSITVTNFSDSDATDEYGVELSLPGPVKVDGVWALMFGSANRGADLKVYENAGTTAMTNGTVTIDDNHGTGAHSRLLAPFPAELTLNAGTSYIVSVRATGTSAQQIYRIGFDNAAHRLLWGVTGGLRTRVNDGAWEAVDDTTIFAIGLSISAIDDGAGGGGGGGATQLIGGGLVR